MLDQDFATGVARSVYGLEPRVIAPLDQLGLDWRGLYLLHDAQDGAWVLRMLRLTSIRDALGATAELLTWLGDQGYPAPRVRRTVDQHLVAEVGGWAVLLLSYVDGTVIDVAEPELLGRAAAALGRLHALPLPTDPHIPFRRCHPDAIAQTALSLVTHAPQLPHRYQPLATALHAATVRLQQLGSARCVTHGDCWYRNAVRTPAGDVVLIDWDRAGVGHPLLDLAYLLFSSHFDLRQPLVLRPAACPARAASSFRTRRAARSNLLRALAHPGGARARASCWSPVIGTNSAVGARGAAGIEHTTSPTCQSRRAFTLSRSVRLACRPSRTKHTATCRQARCERRFDRRRC